MSHACKGVVQHALTRCPVLHAHQVDDCQAALIGDFGPELRLPTSSPHGKAVARANGSGKPTPTSVLQLEEAISELPSSSLRWS